MREKDEIVEEAARVTLEYLRDEFAGCAVGMMPRDKEPEFRIVRGQIVYRVLLSYEFIEDAGNGVSTALRERRIADVLRENPDRRIVIEKSGHTLQPLCKRE